MEHPIGEWLEECDRLLRSGEFDGARAVLAKCLARKIPRQPRAFCAQLCWRLSQPDKGIVVLHAVVRGTGKQAASATPAEKAEYAACLIKCGAHEEGARLLESVAPAAYPRALLYLAFAYVAKWDYAASVPVLKEFLAQKEIPPYDALLGNANLAAALVHERDTAAADKVLTKLLPRLREKKYHQILFRVTLLHLENRIHAGAWGRALTLADGVKKLVGAQDSLDTMLLFKYRAMVSFLQAPASAAGRSSLRQARARAIKWNHWESVRDLDRVEAVTLRDQPLYWKVVFGTPWPPFRELVAREFAEAPPPPAHYEWILKAGSGPLLDPLEKLKPGQVLYRLVSALTSDFYRPLPPAWLHSLVFPDTVFNPASSPTNLRQAIKRLRQTWSKSKVPLAVREERGSYRLEATGPCRIKIVGQRGPGDRLAFLKQELRRATGGQAFSVARAAQVWNLSPRSALRLLGELLVQGALTRTGQKKGTLYHWA